ncbi:glycosyltransferase family 4 protein [Pseudonocardia lacus]|uniref:glycosyltransferase family 4 protein n=1 Tax=Pseudonocardia lacus TaxID=2835865 RepID=UPI001BDC38A0|nr:glycosyltransferase family 4 protein [Pseudonocardia lacus]
MQIDYLVGGLRISLGPGTRTPGPANHIENAVGALRGLGHDVSLYLSAEQPLLRRFATVGEGAAGGSRTPPLVGDAVRLGATAVNAARVAAWSASRPADVVYERAAVLTDLTAAHRWARIGRAVQVVESNGIFSRETAHDRNALAAEGLARRVERRLYRRAHLVVAVSDNLAAELCAYADLPDDKVLVVPNGVPPQVAAVPRPAPGPVVGFAGAVVDWQNLDNLVRAFARVRLARADGRDWRVVVVGDGPAVPALRDAVRDEGLGDAVRFLPRMSRSDLYAEMATWSVGVALHRPTSSGTMYHSPLKLYEYAGLGLTCLVSPSSDATGLQRSGADVVVVEPDADGIAAGLAEVIGRGPVDVDAARARAASVLREHAWTARMESVLGRVDDLVRPGRTAVVR